MQITPLWQKFKQIGLLDRQAIALSDAHQRILEQIKKHQAVIAERKKLLETTAAEHKKISHEVFLKEAEITAVVAKITAKEQRLELAQSPKETLAIEHEIAALTKTCHELEDICLEQMAHLETLTRFMEQDAPTTRAQCEQESAALVALELELESTAAAVVSNRGEQATVISTITPEWFAKYENMKTHIPDPIAPVIQSTCGACFYEVLAQDLVRLKLNAILPCRSCFRLLYCDTEQKQ